MADDLRTLLEGLGSTATEVADFLRGQDCVGLRGVTLECPVANYLRRVWGGEFTVGPYSAEGFRSAGECEHFCECEHPPAIREFIRLFDRGEYPELDSSNKRSLVVALTHAP